MKDQRVTVKHINMDLYDIFWGYGWENHSRIRIQIVPDKPAKFIYISGFVLPYHTRIAVSKYLRLPH